MNKIVAYSYCLLSVIFLLYLSLPSLPFPEKITDSVQSIEDADTETIYRRAYFTDFNREEVLNHYTKNFKLSISNLSIPSYKLSYPPEDAYGLIRDQTRSTHLREIVYPLRESLYVNEFVPKEAKDDIWYKGTHYNQKITVSLKQSTLAVRLFVGISIIVLVGILIIFSRTTLRSLAVSLKMLKWPYFWQ